eukprot:4058689-Pleurochrysis_carterae.AAC.1
MHCGGRVGGAGARVPPFREDEVMRVERVAVQYLEGGARRTHVDNERFELAGVGDELFARKAVHNGVVRLNRAHALVGRARRVAPV